MKIDAGSYILRSDDGGGYVIRRSALVLKGKNAGALVERDPRYFGRLDHAVAMLISLAVHEAPDDSDVTELQEIIEAVHRAVAAC